MTFRIGFVVSVLLFATAAPAAIYKCVAEDGAIAYSQVPCPQQESATVSTPVARTDTLVDCRWASKFANDVARRMRGGLEPDAAFKQYGGIDSVSSGTHNIINYVYRFRRDNSIAVERIASLASNMCKAGSLGDVRCESLPYGQDPSGKACDPDADDDFTGNAPVADTTTASNLVATEAQDQSNNGSRDAVAGREACRDSFRDQIDAIDAEMRSGYDLAQSERYREHLRGLTTSMREC